MTRLGEWHRIGRGVAPPVNGEAGERLRRLWREGPQRAELEGLLRESEAELRAEGLLALARREEAAGRLEAAAELYAVVAQEADAVGAVPPLTGDKRERPLRIRAQEGLDAISGRGAIGPRAEFILRNLARQSSDPAMLLAMGTAGAVFRMTRLATLSRLASTPNPGILTQMFGVGRLASLAGFALEAPAFTLAGRLGSEALGRGQDWSSSALGRDIASSYLVLGGLKLAGWGSGAAYRRFASPVGAVRERPLLTLFQQGGMLAGIMIGHSLEEHLGLRPHQDGATTLTDSLAMLLQFNIAGRLTRQAFGNRFAAWERGLDLRAEVLSQRPPQDRFGNFGTATALARPASWAPVPHGESPALVRPTLVFMTGKGRGGGSGRQGLEAARRLRLEIAPEEAWRRRAEQAADYVARLKSLPTGQRETLEEAQQGLDLLGAWAAGRDGFRKAIAFRHYAELWRFLADGWNPASLHAAMTESFRAQVDRHRELLGAERNPRFLQVALEASPQIGRIYSHTRVALIEGSPRERDLSESLESLLAVLRAGAEAPKATELRPRYLEAFHDTLNNSVGDRLGLAREAHEGIRLARRWMLGADRERRVLGGNYFPQFWRRLAERAHPAFKDAMLEDLQQEIVFLQQHTRPHGVPRETLLASLRAFPYYAETVFRSVDPAPGNIFMLVQTFLSQARALRPWILDHADPEVRAECARSYLRLMDQVQSHAGEILEYERMFPVSANGQVVQELAEALAPFTQRLKTQGAEELLPAIRDYQELVLLLPPRPDFARDLLSEANLKPLMRQQYHPDPRIRPAIEELLVKLLHRFSGTASGDGPSN